jgi:hypothetical protein
MKGRKRISKVVEVGVRLSRAGVGISINPGIMKSSSALPTSTSSSQERLLGASRFNCIGSPEESPGIVWLSCKLDGSDAETRIGQVKAKLFSQDLVCTICGCICYSEQGRPFYCLHCQSFFSVVSVEIKIWLVLFCCVVAEPNPLLGMC